MVVVKAVHLQCMSLCLSESCLRGPGNWLLGRDEYTVPSGARRWKGMWGSEAQVPVGEEGRKDGLTIV